LIVVVGILLIAAATGIVTLWAYRVDEREREEIAAAYQELYEKLSEKQKS